MLGLIDAGLGRKKEARRRRAARDRVSAGGERFTNGAHMIEFAIIAALVGEQDLACEQLSVSCTFPATERTATAS